MKRILKSIPYLCAENLRKIEKLEAINITTNGLTLTRQLLPMQKAGLSGLNISLDTLNPKKFEEITRRKGMERVIAGIDLAIQLGYKPKINCVAMKGQTNFKTFLTHRLNEPNFFF